MIVLGNYIGDDTGQIHAVTAVGYIEDKNLSGEIVGKRIFIHDPWRPCAVGGTKAEVSFPFSTAPNTLRANSYIHHIYNSKDPLCKCKKPTTKKTITTTIDNQYHQLLLELERISSPVARDKMQSNKKLGAIKVKQLSYKKLRKNLPYKENSLEQYFIDNDIIDLTFNKKATWDKEFAICRMENIGENYKNTINRIEGNLAIFELAPNSTIIEADFLTNRFEYKEINNEKILIPLDNAFNQYPKGKPIPESIFLEQIQSFIK